MTILGKAEPGLHQVFSTPERLFEICDVVENLEPTDSNTIEEALVVKVGYLEFCNRIYRALMCRALDEYATHDNWDDIIICLGMDSAELKIYEYADSMLPSKALKLISD